MTAWTPPATRCDGPTGPAHAGRNADNQCSYCLTPYTRIDGVTRSTPERAAWTPPGRLPIGQYRVTMLITGDAVGPDTLYWLINDRLASPAGSAITGRVETIDTLTPGTTTRPTPTAHIPMRDSDVAAWIKKNRDGHDRRGEGWHVLDALLDDYRDHADTGTPLTETVAGPNGDDR